MDAVTICMTATCICTPSRNLEPFLHVVVKAPLAELDHQNILEQPGVGRCCSFAVQAPLFHGGLPSHALSGLGTQCGVIRYCKPRLRQ